MSASLGNADRRLTPPVRTVPVDELSPLLLALALLTIFAALGVALILGQQQQCERLTTPTSPAASCDAPSPEPR